MRGAQQFPFVLQRRLRQQIEEPLERIQLLDRQFRRETKAVLSQRTRRDDPELDKILGSDMQLLIAKAEDIQRSSAMGAWEECGCRIRKRMFVSSRTANYRPRVPYIESRLIASSGSTGPAVEWLLIHS